MNDRAIAPAPDSPADIAIIAGESSGDLLGAGLIRALILREPGLRIEGVAGRSMIAAGCASVYPIERLSVMGFAEVAGRYVSLMQDRRKLAQRWIAQPPRVFVGIDAPDFNLGLERRLRQHSIPTVHYVSPSVWAWRRYRVRGIRAAVDKMLTLFPFEAKFYEHAGVPVQHVGHPLADLIDLQVDMAGARAQLRLDPSATCVALLPGSRRMEVEQLTMLLLDTARWLHQRDPSLRFVMPAATESIYARLKLAVDAADLPVSLVQGMAREAMAASNVVVLASGTATLEALLSKRPMVITYKVHPLTYQIMKRMLKVTHVGLPNLLANKALVPERLQHDATAETLGRDVLEWLDSPLRVAQVVEQFDRIHHELRCDASERAADAVLAQMRR